MMHNARLSELVFKRMQRRSSRHTGTSLVAVGRLETKFGPISIAATEDAVVLISLPGEEKDEYFSRRLAQLLPDAERLESTPVLNQALRELREYVSGKRRTFDVPYELYTTPFRRTVLRRVATIPYGQVTSYGEIAKAAGHSRAVRAVGSANASNTLPIIVPCHRVIASNGIGGYGGGLELKRKLLVHEGFDVELLSKLKSRSNSRRKL